MSTLYYVIRYRDPFALLDVKLNIELEKAEDAIELTKYAKHVRNMSFDDHPAVLETLVGDIEDGRFLGIPQEYLLENVMNPNNNLLILFSLNRMSEVQIEGVLTYSQMTKGRKDIIKIPAIAIIDLPKKDLHISGSTLMNWVYRKMKDAGGSSIEIDAIGSSMSFWNQKMGFSWRKLNPKGKRADIIREIKRIQNTLKMRLSKKTREELEEEIKTLYYHIPYAPMKRERSDQSENSVVSSNETSPNMLTLLDIREMRKSRVVPATLRRARSMGFPSHKKTVRRRKAHSK